MVAILHNVRSVHNVASIFRTADAAGIEKLYLCGITPSPLDRFGTVRAPFAKVALGAEGCVTWEQRVETTTLIRELQRAGYQVAALEQAARARPYRTFTPRGELAIVVGGEVEGLPLAVLRAADAILEIPMHGKKESLNVAVAFGIIAFHSRQHE